MYYHTSKIEFFEPWVGPWRGNIELRTETRPQEEILSLFVLPSCFLLELNHYVSLNFGMVLENLIKLCVPDVWGKRFMPLKFGGMGQNRVYWI